MNTVLLSLALMSQVVSQPTVSPFECRSATPVMPPLLVIRSEDDRRQNVREWWYETEGQIILGQRARFLSHLRGRDEEYGVSRYHYTSIVDGDVNLVRWLVERASPDIRCSPNGAGFTCLMADRIGTRNMEVRPQDRTVSIYPANGDEFLDGIAEGVVIACSWERDDQ